MNKSFFILVFILLIANISAQCNETQIDINSASVEELDNLAGIGPAYAERIIAMRPFSSVDDLINVSGIGNKTLDKIKQQRLACVNENEVDSQSEENNSEALQEESAENETIEEIKETKVIEDYNREEDAEENISAKELNSITLNAKSIKSEESTEFSGKNLAFFGVIAFCVIFGALFFIKKQKYKNEFN